MPAVLQIQGRLVQLVQLAQLVQPGYNSTGYGKRHCWDSNILGKFLYLPTIQDLPVSAVCVCVAVRS